jgi:GxxExxY protein
MEEPTEEEDAVLRSVVDAVGRVRSALAVGLLERLYMQALAIELAKRGHQVVLGHRVQVAYDGVPLDGHYVIDMLVDGVVVELKAAAELHPSAFAQTLTYLKATGTRVGLLVNFHAVPLRAGIHRLIRPGG